MFAAFASITTTLILIALIVILGITYMIIDTAALAMKDLEDLPEEMHGRKIKQEEFWVKVRSLFRKYKKKLN